MPRKSSGVGRFLIAMVIIAIILLGAPQKCEAQTMTVKFDGQSYAFICDSLALAWEEDMQGSVRREDANGNQNSNGTVVHVLLRGQGSFSDEVWKKNRVRLGNAIRTDSRRPCLSANLRVVVDTTINVTIDSTFVIRKDTTIQVVAPRTRRDTVVNLGGSKDTLVTIDATQPRMKQPFVVSSTLPFDGGVTLSVGKASSTDFSRSYWNFGGGTKSLGVADSTSILLSASAGATAELFYLPLMTLDTTGATFGLPILFGADANVLSGLTVFSEDFVLRMESEEANVIDQPSGRTTIERSWVDEVAGWRWHTSVLPVNATLTGKLGTAFGPLAVYGVAGTRIHDVTAAQRDFSFVWGLQMDLKSKDNKGLFALSYLNSKNLMIPETRLHQFSFNMFLGGKHYRRR